jgi:hypothetical protein
MVSHDDGRARELVFKRALALAYLVLHQSANSDRVKGEASARVRELLRSVEAARSIGVPEAEIRGYIAAGMVDRSSPFDECGRESVPVVHVEFQVETKRDRATLGRELESVLNDLQRSLRAAGEPRVDSEAEKLLDDVLSVVRPDMPLELRELMARRLAASSDVVAAVMRQSPRDGAA